MRLICDPLALNNLYAILNSEEQTKVCVTFAGRRGLLLEYEVDGTGAFDGFAVALGRGEGPASGGCDGALGEIIHQAVFMLNRSCAGNAALTVNGNADVDWQWCG